ncbi:hypothetical protein HWV62_16394 [Athelia sp. TMB]|nr:hypothetical protein HWV62_16394 [Athelia sp. TMB]
MLYSGPAASCPCSINYADSIIIPPSPVLPTQIDPNYAPTTSERLHIRADLMEIESDLALLDSALEHLKAAQERLQLKRSALQQHAAACAALLAPIRRVPPEILAEVFVHFLPAAWRDDSADARRSRMLPSHVCKRWRELSLSLSHFWADISVMVDSKNIDKKLECAKLWLARSGSCPLSVFLSCLDPDCGAQWQSLLDIVLPHSTRWVHASLFSVIPGTLATLKDNLPMLESVVVAFPAWPSNAPFESAPNLHFVQANARDLSNDAGFPWVQLTEVEVSNSSVQQSLSILKKLPNAVSYKVTVCYPTNTDSATEHHEVPPVRLDHLKYLEVFGEANISGFHESLELPSLTSYTYDEAAESTTWWSMSSLSSLFARSSCLIEDINIMLASAVDEHDLALLLLHTPSLEILDIGSYLAWGATSNSVLQALAIRSEATCLAPKLQRLSLYYDQDFDLQLFTDTIESRWRLEGGAPLKAPLEVVEVHNVDDITSLDAGLLRRLQEGPDNCEILFMDKDEQVIKDWGLRAD